MTNPPTGSDESRPDPSTLSAEELLRYGRQLSLPRFGVDGQRRLKAARVLIVGAGGLGSPAALYLAGAGIGTLGLVDFDVVDVTNLHRQLLHGSSDVGRPKLDSARDRLREVNPHVRLECHDTRLSASNAMEILRGYDVVLDGTDNFATRYLVNDACVLLDIPNVYGAIFRFEGQASLFSTADGPCYRCLYPEPPPPGTVPSCAEGGVLGVLPGLVGLIQATECIKLVAGIGDSLAGRLLLFDALGMQFRSVRIQRDPACPMCATRTITELVDYDVFCGTPATPEDADPIALVAPRELAARLARGEDLELIDVREPHEWDAGHVAGARLLPLGALHSAMASLDASREVIVMCQGGGRSATAARALRAAGFAKVASLEGGMTRWRADVGDVRG